MASHEISLWKAWKRSIFELSLVLPVWAVVLYSAKSLISNPYDSVPCLAFILLGTVAYACYIKANFSGNVERNELALKEFIIKVINEENQNTPTHPTTDDVPANSNDK